MYYCLSCKEIHHQITEFDQIFHTGFHRMKDGTDIPIGICASSESLKKNLNEE